MLSSRMQLLTLEVELREGRVFPTGTETLPDHAKALLTLLPVNKPKIDPFVTDPRLHVTFYEDPTLPLTEEEWPGLSD